MTVAIVAPFPVARRDVVVYELSPTSQFEVKTGKAGLLGFAGHEHLIRARAFQGRVEYHPDTPGDSRVEIVVPTGGQLPVPVVFVGTNGAPGQGGGVPDESRGNGYDQRQPPCIVTCTL